MPMRARTIWTRGAAAAAGLISTICPFHKCPAAHVQGAKGQGAPGIFTDTCWSACVRCNYDLRATSSFYNYVDAGRASIDAGNVLSKLLSETVQILGQRERGSIP